MTALGRFSLKVVAFRRRFFTSGRYEGPVSRHFDGRKFRNHIQTRDWSSHVMKWLLNRRAETWPKWIDAPAGPTPPARIHGSGLRVTFVNHSTVLVQTAGLNMLTDPVFSDKVGPFPWLGAGRIRDPGLSFEQLPKIDVILLSHDHYDHLDLPSLKRILERDKPRLLCGLGVERTLEIDGLEGAEALDWWQSATLAPDVRATFAPSRHFSGRGLQDQDSTLWGSFVVTGPAGPVYFGGDTGYGPHFAEIRERFGPMACALLPIGCYEPRWFMETFHMSPADAVKAHCDLDSRFSVGIHYGTFQLGDESYERPALDLKAALAAHGVEEPRFVVPGFGEGIDVAKLVSSRVS